MLRKRALYDDMSRFSSVLETLWPLPDSSCKMNSTFKQQNVTIASLVCACMQTQHKVEMDKRDGKFGPQPMAVPPVQQMSRIDQPIPPAAGYPPAAYGQPYPAQGYPPAAYPPPQYPPSGYSR
ncbi:PLAC8 family protein [Gossypium australe]|uniref:PLAC8 family protein n=1 Tax=Gossypium australe TaxID=47621 RepID=A0A5B6VL96_9ROSI|nr:PLAC8 family protein [Gossypium australe]